nr:hypothetical protein [Sphingobium sp. Ant17]
MVNGAPEVNHLAADLDVHLIKVPAPVAKAFHMADIDVALEEQIFYVPPAERVADIHQHHQQDTSGDELK